jgi:hypothetical protein
MITSLSQLQLFNLTRNFTFPARTDFLLRKNKFKEREKKNPQEKTPVKQYKQALLQKY